MYVCPEIPHHDISESNFADWTTTVHILYDFRIHPPHIVLHDLINSKICGFYNPIYKTKHLYHSHTAGRRVWQSAIIIVSLEQLDQWLSQTMAPH